MGIEPTLSAWEAEVLPLNYTRILIIILFLQNSSRGEFMEIFLNGEHCQVNEKCNITELVKNLNLENKRLAVEVNSQIVPRSQFTFYALSPGDKVEIVHAIGGG